MRAFLGIALAVLVSGWAAQVQAHAAFTVNTTADSDDGSCELLPDGDCSLREAIQAANDFLNDHPDAPDSVLFDFGDGALPPFTIVLDSPLPPITEGLILDGRSEPRFIVSREHVPVIIIDGGGFDDVLRIRSNNTLVLTVGFTNAAVSAIDAENADYLLVQGCYFGVHPDTGESMAPGPGQPAFGSHAIHVRDTLRPRVGGQGELARNLITGAGAAGILVESSDNLVLHGNYIGVDPSGLEARPNMLEDSLAFAVDLDSSSRSEIWDNTISANFGGGVRLSNATSTSLERNKIGVDATGRLGLGNAGPGLTIDGDASGLGIFDNTISANAGHGISCLDGASGPWLMKRNLIGVDIAQSDTLPNEGDGVHLESGCADGVIGDEAASDGNLIAHNDGAGVRMIGSDTTVLGNSVFLNRGLSIDAAALGRSENDPSDESLPTNYPEAIDFEREDDTLQIRACVATGAIIEIYEALSVPDATAGALRLLASATEGSDEDTDDSVACSDFNDAAFELTLSAEESVTSLVLTATAQGRTSELSDLLDLDGGTTEPEGCASASDCSPPEPVCDPVFRRCMVCIDNEAADALDSGCSAEMPRCVEGACAEPEQPPPRAGPPLAPEPATGSRCSATFAGDSGPGGHLWILLVCGVTLALRRRTRINT